MIRIFPSTLAGRPIEEHDAAELTLHAWLSQNVREYHWGPVQPISATLNGINLDPEDWDEIELNPDDICDLHIMPRGGVVSSIGSLLGGIFNSVFGWILPQQKQPGSQAGIEQGREIAVADATANQPRLNQVIPEIAGAYKRFPDYLAPPRRYYQDRETQVIEMLLCVGVGKYQINPNQIYIGETSLLSLGQAASFTIYEPGANLASDSRSVWWYTAPEVGGTSAGTPGIELTTSFTVDRFPDATSYLFDGMVITVPDGAGQFPEGWAAGMILRVVLPKTYTLSDQDGRTVIAGDIASLDPFTGMLIEIIGDNEGVYVVDEIENGSMTLNYMNGSPVLLPQGNAVMSIGYVGHRYRITDASAPAIAVQRLTDEGSIDDSWSGWQPARSTDAEIEIGSEGEEGGWNGPFPACPEGERATQIEVDILFPGLIGIDKKGRPFSVAVDVEIQYRDLETAGEWTSITRRYSAASQDHMGFTLRASLNVPMRPEVRVRRIGAESISTNVQDKAAWYGLKGRIERQKFHYDDVTVMTLRIAGLDKIAAQTENQISMVATRVLPLIENGQPGAERPTRSIVDFAAYIMNGTGIGNVNWAEMQRLRDLWEQRGDTFDHVFDEASVAEALSTVFAAGSAEISREMGQLIPVREEARTQFQQLYTPQAMTQRLSRAFRGIKPDDADGVDVEYTDSRTWTSETVECRLPGDVGARPEKLKLLGVTDRTRAWRIGMRRRRQLAYERWEYTFSTELAAMNSSHGDYVALADDVPGFGRSSLMIGVDSTAVQTTIISSERFDWGGGDHVIAIRRPDGTLSGPWPATRIDDHTALLPAIDFIPNLDPNIEPPHLLFGPAERWMFPALVTSRRPGPDQTVAVTAKNYDVRIYADDDNSPA